MQTTQITGYPTPAEASAAPHHTSGYRSEVVDLASPFGGPTVGSGYALLLRGSYAAEAPLGAWDVRLCLPGREWIDDAAEAARILGVRS